MQNPSAAAPTAPPAISISEPLSTAPDAIERVGVFIPKRLAWRTTAYVGHLLSVMKEHQPRSDDEFVFKECLLELQKALDRAGYPKEPK